MNNTAILGRSLPALALAGALAATLAACGKATEVATEKVMEKSMESAITKDGGTAKVNIGAGGVKAEGVDKDGKAYKMEMGSASLGEKDFNLAFYPGARPVADKSTKVRNGDIEVATIELESTADAKTVSDWYRSKLKGRADGVKDAVVIENGKDRGGMSLQVMLPGATDAQGETLSVEVTAGDAGSTIALMRGGPAR